jgi:ATP-binding cassette, subfamily B, bacterial
VLARASLRARADVAGLLVNVHRLVPGEIVRTLRLVWESTPGWTMASVGLLLAQAALSLAALVLVKLVVDAVTAGLASGDPAAAVERVAIWIGLAAAVALLGALCKAADTAIGEIQRDLVSDHLQGLVHAKAVEVDVEYYDNAEYYNALHRAQAEAPQRASAMLTNLLQVGRGGVSLLAIAGLLVAFNWWVALVLIVGDLPGALVRIRGAWELYQWQRRSTATEVQSRYYSQLVSSPYLAQEVRLFDLGGLFAERFRVLRQRLRGERQRLAARRLTAELAAQVAATVAIYGAYGFVAYQVLAGALTLGDLVMYYAAFQRGQGHLEECLFGLARMYQDSLFLADLSEFLALDPKVPEPASPRPVPRPLRGGLALEHVDFAYPGAKRLALDDVSLTIRPGERIAIVGPNGSGKTTLVKLLCRLYDPTAGRITADGIPLTCFGKAAWRRELSVLFQQHGMYCLTARENIWLGSQAPPGDDGPIVAAARRSGADAVIERLPRRYDTRLGGILGEGVELSVGEWQKIALARAYVRDAPIVILDEPTSALDALAEEQLIESFWHASDERITIVISHRLSTARRADRIYVLAGGRIVEEGTHDELMRRGDTYAQFFAAQAQHYR